MTLPETLMAIVIFTAMLTLVVLINQTGLDALDKTAVHSDSYRMAMLALEVIKRELHGARLDVIYPDPPTEPLTELYYYPVKMTGDGRYVQPTVEGRMEPDTVDPLTGEGDIVCLATIEAKGIRYLVRRVLKFDNSVNPPALVKVKEVRLAPLGDRGQATFRRSPVDDTPYVTASIKTTKSDPDHPGKVVKQSEYDIGMTIYMPNK